MVLLLGVGACGSADDFMAKRSKSSEAAAEAESLAAEVEALQQQALARDQAEEQARLEAEAAAEAAALAEAEAQAALEAAERELAEKEALLAQREQQLRQQRALLAEQERLASEKAAVEAREKELFEREREIEAREVNMAVAEDELRERAVERDLGANAQAYEPGGWTGEVTPVDSGGNSGGDESGYGETGDGGYADGVLEDGYPEGDTWEADAQQEPLPGTGGASTRASLQPGKVMEVEILETLSSSTHRRGDTFSARLVQDLRAEDGTLVIAAGAQVEGEVVEVTPLKRVGGQASIGIEFTRIDVAPGESVEIRASVTELGVDRSKDRKKIIGATIAGAILGRVLGGKGSENAVLGAAVGAAAGTAATARTNGKDAVIPAGEMVALQLEEVVTVEIGMTGTVEPQ
jgi:hypothetical protein